MQERRSASFITQGFYVTYCISQASQSNRTIRILVLSHVPLSEAPWTVVPQASLSVEFFRQECWSGLPFSLPGDLPYPETEPMSPVSPALPGRFFTTEPPGKPKRIHKEMYIRGHSTGIGSQGYRG